MAYLEAACDATVDGKWYKKGQKLPSELANYPLAKIVEEKIVKEESKIKGIARPSEVPKKVEEPSKSLDKGYTEKEAFDLSKSEQIKVLDFRGIVPGRLEADRVKQILKSNPK